MRSVRNSLRSRGISSTVCRAMTMTRRYGLFSRRMKETLTIMSEDSKQQGFGLTVPVTGGILNRERAEFLRGITHDLFEIAIHGFRHDDFSRLSDIDMKTDLIKAITTFRKHALKVVGYRAPYLRFQEGHAKILEDNAIEYSSSGIVTPERNSLKYQTLLEKADMITHENYGKSLNGLIKSGNYINIPVSMPDDEILIDRMKIRDQDVLTDLFFDIIDSSIRSNGFCVLQMHPERYKLLRDPINNVVGRLKDKGDVNFVTLSSLAKILKERKTDNNLDENSQIVCVTGDLDLMSIWDLW